MRKSQPPKVKLKKAKVYIWPNLNQDQLNEIEADCVYAGYTDKRYVSVGRVKCWEVT